MFSPYREDLEDSAGDPKLRIISSEAHNRPEVVFRQVNHSDFVIVEHQLM
jgi:hypothetical protein